MSAPAALLLAAGGGRPLGRPFCDPFRSAPPEKQGAYILRAVDEAPGTWPQRDAYTRMTTDAERPDAFGDARKRIIAECVSGRDFAAGIGLGDDIAACELSLLEVGKRSEHQHQARHPTL